MYYQYPHEDFRGCQFQKRKPINPPRIIKNEKSILSTIKPNNIIKHDPINPSIPSIKFTKLIIAVIKIDKKIPILKSKLIKFIEII